MGYVYLCRHHDYCPDFVMDQNEQFVITENLEALLCPIANHIFIYVFKHKAKAITNYLNIF